jgi:sialate O-acetylesterase
MLQLASPIQDNMVLQQGCSVPIWGMAEVGAHVTVRFQRQTHRTVAAGGRWMVQLDPLIAGGPFRLTVNSRNKVIRRDNVLVGEVWLCAGQSNMNRPLAVSTDSKEDIAKANHPRLRVLRILPDEKTEPAPSFRGGRWQVATPENVAGVSGVGFYFGMELMQRYDIPVGIIHLANGGRSLGTFVPSDYSADYIDEANYQRQADDTRPWVAGGMYCGMICPLRPYAIRGMVWYQGEADLASADWWEQTFPTFLHILSTDFLFEKRQFPVIMAELAPWGLAPGRSMVGSRQVEFRDMQWRLADAINNLHVVSLLDQGHTDVHPPDKRPPGRRMAAVAKAKVYGDNCLFSGPEPLSAVREGRVVTITFKHVGAGLSLVGDKPAACFEIGESEVWGQLKRNGAVVKQIGKDKIRVRHAGVANPTIVRYAWSGWPAASLFNCEGWPARSFRIEVEDAPAEGVTTGHDDVTTVASES